jgi:BirA family biotin operon repressor/biotin-[acetyl-CoA-carboxylase] ligase
VTSVDLDPERIAEMLTTGRYGRSLTIIAETESTNDDARRAVRSGAPDGHTIVADAQRRGRGSHGRTWLSPPGVDLYVSILARLDMEISSLPPLTLAVGLAVADTVTQLSQVSAQVKWPNDVWIEGRKVAGALVETSSSGDQAEPVVIGIGLNVNRREFPAELDTPATSLSLAAGTVLDRSRVLACLLGHVEAWVDRFASEGPEPIAAAVNERLSLRGTLCRCDSVQGIVEGVHPRGSLLLRDSDGVREVYAGTLRAV